MKVRVLGAAAGGGFPQWNCGCAMCRRPARAMPTPCRARRPRSPSPPMAITGCCSMPAPICPARLPSPPACIPPPAPRGSPIAAVVLTGADIDCITGLLSLREGHEFGLYGPASVLDILRAQCHLRCPAYPPRAPPRAGCRRHRGYLRCARRAARPARHAFPVGGKIPLYTETSDKIEDLISPDAVIGLEITDAAGTGSCSSPAATPLRMLCAPASRAPIFCFSMARSGRMTR